MQADAAATPRSPGMLTWIVACALFMEALDGTVVVTALPQIAASFGVAAEELGLGVTAYLTALTIFIPTSAWAAERFGSRKVFVAAVGLFTLSSVACGLADSLPAFIAARVVQGFAAAMMSPVGRLVLLRATPKSLLVGVIAAITWPALIAPVVGPPLGGFIAEHASWRWIFYLNLPLGLVGMVLAARYTPDQKSEAPLPFDTPGFLLTGAALGFLVLGLDLLGRVGAALTLGAALTALGLLAGAAAVWRARTAAQPMLNLRPLAEPLFRITSGTAGFIIRLAIQATPFLLPLMFQLGFGYDAFHSGLMLLVYMAGNLCMKSVTTPILRTVGFRRVLVAACAGCALTLAAYGTLTPDTPMVWIYAVLLLGGAARSMTFTAVITLTFAGTAPDDRPAATSLSALSQQLSFTLGVALAALALNFALGLWPAAGLELPHFHAAFLFTAALAAIAAVWFARLAPDAGREVSGHRG